MLTIWCVYIGNKYPVEYVHNLYWMVQKNSNFAFTFKCITDQIIPIFDQKRRDFCKIESVPALQFDVPSDKLWFHKLSLFHYANGPSIYFDLDTIICGNLSPLLFYLKEILAMPKNWAQSGHGGWQSSCMIWNGELRKPFDLWEPSVAKRLHGDQCFITEVMSDQVTAINPNLILSYKYHVNRPRLKRPPKDAIAITFHGQPDYHEVGDQWVTECLSTPTQPWSNKRATAAIS